MKKVLMMIQESCPYCRQALRMMDELKEERPEYKAVEVKIVDENREKALADSLDYWYVPTYFVDGVRCTRVCLLWKRCGRFMRKRLTDRKVHKL